eukprot:10824420-Prorocentrum_lima.AAC.1
MGVPRWTFQHKTEAVAPSQVGNRAMLHNRCHIAAAASITDVAPMGSARREDARRLPEAPAKHAEELSYSCKRDG